MVWANLTRVGAPPKNKSNSRASATAERSRSPPMERLPPPPPPRFRPETDEGVPCTTSKAPPYPRKGPPPPAPKPPEHKAPATVQEAKPAPKWKRAGMSDQGWISRPPVAPPKAMPKARPGSTDERSSQVAQLANHWRDWFSGYIEQAPTGYIKKSFAEEMEALKTAHQFYCRNPHSSWMIANSLLMQACKEDTNNGWYAHFSEQQRAASAKDYRNEALLQWRYLHMKPISSAPIWKYVHYVRGRPVIVTQVVFLSLLLIPLERQHRKTSKAEPCFFDDWAEWDAVSVIR